MLRTPGSSEIFTISLRDGDEEQIVGQMGGIEHFGFRLREPLNMEDVVTTARDLGATPIEHGGSKEKGRLYAYIKDPDGYDLEIFWEE